MRRNVATPYGRGEETRARVIGAAVRLFGTRGFDSVTTREIAQASAVPQASLRYYFENKQGLYIACLEHIQGLIMQRMAPALTSAEAILSDSHVNYDGMIDSFCALQDAMVDTLVGGGDGGAAALLVIRHDLPSNGGSGKLSGDGTGIHRVSDCFARMMQRISARALDLESASRIVGIINGQFANIYLRRDRLSSEGWDVTPPRLCWIKSVIRLQTSAILHAYRLSDDANLKS